MKLLTRLLILILAASLNSCSTDEGDKSKFIDKEFWTNEKSIQHFLNRQDSSKWDYDILNEDLKRINSYSSPLNPLLSGIFPTPKYDLLGQGSFNGLGMLWRAGGEGYEKKIDNKTILYNAFYIKKSKLNEARLGNRKDEIFFQIIVLTDFIDTLNYAHFSTDIVSRNHPDYIGQGHFSLITNGIDYIAFATADRNSYAIINMRLFDLRLGKTILIAPQVDKSFRSMQIESPPLTSEEIDEYTDRLLSQKDVVYFFTRSGNI